MTVSATAGGVPTGTVKVLRGFTTACTATLSHGTGTCSLKAKQLKKGSHALCALFVGDANHLSSASATATLKITYHPPGRSEQKRATPLCCTAWRGNKGPRDWRARVATRRRGSHDRACMRALCRRVDVACEDETSAILTSSRPPGTGTPARAGRGVESSGVFASR